MDWFHIPVIIECSVWGFEKWDLSFLCLTQDTFWIKLFFFFFIFFAMLLLSISAGRHLLILSDRCPNMEPLHTSITLCHYSLLQSASFIMFNSRVPLILLFYSIVPLLYSKVPLPYFFTRNWLLFLFPYSIVPLYPRVPPLYFFTLECLVFTSLLQNTSSLLLYPMTPLIFTFVLHVASSLLLLFYLFFLISKIKILSTIKNRPLICKGSDEVLKPICKI